MNFFITEQSTILIVNVNRTWRYLVDVENYWKIWKKFEFEFGKIIVRFKDFRDAIFAISQVRDSIGYQMVIVCVLFTAVWWWQILYIDGVFKITLIFGSFFPNFFHWQIEKRFRSDRFVLKSMKFCKKMVQSLTL